MKKLLLLFFIICGITATSFAQSKNDDDFPDPEVLSSKILKDYEKLSDLEDNHKNHKTIKPVKPVNANHPANKTTKTTDPLISTNPNSVTPHHYQPYNANSYKIIIYNGHDRNEAENIKNKFLSYFPNEYASVVFETPTYKVRVGNYSTNAIARKKQRKLLEYFHFAMVIPPSKGVSPKN